MKWLIDDGGDLINSDHIEVIQLSPLQDKKEIEALGGDTHEVLAINPESGSYRLITGSEKFCREAMKNLAKDLGAHSA